MKKYYLYIAFLFFVLFSTQSCFRDIPEEEEPLDICKESENIFPFVSSVGKRYELVKEKTRWKSAASCAVKRGGYLIEINDADEQNDVYLTLSSLVSNEMEDLIISEVGGAYIWIGANNFVWEKRWLWDGDGDNNGPMFWLGDSTGGPVDGLYNNWGVNPDISTDHNAVAMSMTNWDKGVAGNWNDIQEQNYLFYVIEYDE